MKIEAVIASMPYEKEPFFPYRYSAETIAGLESTIGVLFPDDFRWYLLNVGWREIDYDYRTILLRRGDYLHDLKFKAAVNEVFALNGYSGFTEGNEGGLLPGNKKLYFPFGEISGGNPVISLRLLVSLNTEDRGSIWAVRSIGHFGDQNPSTPIRLADDLAGFLEQVGPDKKLRPVAEKKNEALFLRLMADYIASTTIRPTIASDPEMLITAFFERPGEMIFDGARNVEYQHRVNAQRIENQAEFSEKADWYATKLPTNRYHAPPPLQRSEISISPAQVFDRSYAFQCNHGYYLITVESLVGDGHRLSEEYLLHHGHEGWTMVRRYGATIGDVKVRGIGTFAFDSTYKWKLKKKVTPAWSELPFELNVDGEEDALTASRIAFIKNIVGNGDFRRVFEACVFELYTGTMYPEFEAMADDEKAEWADCYPQIRSPDEIWRLFGKKRAIHVESDDTFSLAIDASWDTEHGLTLTVEDWLIRR